MNPLIQIKNRIEKAARAKVLLVTVSKGQPLEKIKAARAAGQRDFGENHAQELIEKAAGLAGTDLCWHFLGHLQTNKLNKVLPLIAWLHSLDSFDLAQAIQKRAKAPLPCLLEIKLSREKTKTGLPSEAALALIPKLKDLDNIDLRGLMTIPPLDPDPEKSRPYFRQLFSLLKTINGRYLYSKPLTELSMGMSRDFEIAIEEGATMVRIGTAIFGERPKK